MPINLQVVTSHKYKIILVLASMVLSSCGTLNQVATPSDVPPIVAAARATSTAPLVGISTPSGESTIVAAQQIGPESFAKAHLLHEYWPAIQKAAGLPEGIRFGPSQTGWALSPDGRYVAVAGCDQEAGDALDPESTTCEHTKFETTSHAFLYILDAQTEQVIAKLPETGQILTVGNLSFTHDSSKLVYAVYPNTIHIWDIKTGQVEKTFSDPDLYPGSYSISADDKFIALGFASQLKIWDLTQKAYVKEFPNYGSPIFSADGPRLLVYDPVLKIYDTNTWQEISQQNMMPTDSLEYYQESPNLSLMAVCRKAEDDQPVKVWDTATAALLQTLKNEVGKCLRLFFTPNGNYLLLFNNHGAGPVVWSVRDWKLYKDSEQTTNFVGATDKFVERIQFSQDGTLLLVGTLTRLTLYELPKSEMTPAEASAPTEALAASSSSTSQTAMPTLEPKPQSCSAVVTGWLKLNVQSCVPTYNTAIVTFSQQLLQLSLLGEHGVGVVISVPPNLQKHLVPGKYVIGDDNDAQDEWRMTAQFESYDPTQNVSEVYSSYAETGQVVITEIGSNITGTFEFGARNMDGRQINVKGSFENIPFNTNKP